jgi:cell division protein FtsW (lipid II flippase)
MNDKEVANAEIRTCGGDSKVNAERTVMAAVPVGLLAVMGLVFLWCCPEWRPGALGPHWHFWRQLAWNAVGAAALCIPILAGWTRWLKAAPVMAAAWVAALAAAQFCPEDGGGWYLFLGPMRLDVLAMLPIVVGMLFAWIAHKRGYRARRMLVVLGIGCLIVLTARVTADANRVSRLAAVFGGEPPSKELAENDSALARAWAQKMCVEAVDASHWFSGNKEYLKENPLPGRYTSAMPAAAALALGKWFLAVVGALFALFACCFVRAWLDTKDESRRTFLAGSGLFVFISAIMGVCECLGLTPMLYTCVPLVSFGGTAVVVLWLIAGTLAAMSI